MFGLLCVELSSPCGRTWQQLNVDDLTCLSAKKMKACPRKSGWPWLAAGTPENVRGRDDAHFLRTSTAAQTGRRGNYFADTHNYLLHHRAPNCAITTHPSAMASTFAPRSFASSVCQSCRLRLKPSTFQRPFSTSVGRKAEDGSLNQITDILNSPTSLLYNDRASENLDARLDQKSHRLHVLTTKHNTHLTLVQPPKSAAQTPSSGISSINASAAEQKKMVDVLLSLSAGNIGFRKAGRGSYDAAYQLTAFTLKTMKEKGMLRDIQGLEVVIRGFGAGREAVTKALLGAEGRIIRKKITAVVDATRLKIGGTRSPRPRRLG